SRRGGRAMRLLQLHARLRLAAQRACPAAGGRRNALAYDEAAVLAMNPLESELSLPGWDESYTKEQLGALMRRYQALSEDDLWRNLQTFLSAVVPAAEEAGIRMAIHPDDPPWGIFGLPRIIT